MQPVCRGDPSTPSSKGVGSSFATTFDFFDATSSLSKRPSTTNRPSGEDHSLDVPINPSRHVAACSAVDSSPRTDEFAAR